MCSWSLLGVRIFQNKAQNSGDKKHECLLCWVHTVSILATMATLLMSHWTSTGGVDDRGWLMSSGQVALSAWLLSSSSTPNALCELYHEKQRLPPLFPTPICLSTWIYPRHPCFWPSHLSPSRPLNNPFTTDLESEYILTLWPLLLLHKGIH